MKKGDLVSVDVGDPKWEFYSINVDLVTEHGYLWFLIDQEETDYDDERVPWNCRALATGYTAQWLEDEMQVQHEEG